MRKTGLTDAGLRDAVREMVQGLVDADLGGHLLKIAHCAGGPRQAWRFQNHRSDQARGTVVLSLRVREERACQRQRR
ncbi:MAG: type II toxin-antitoxin system RelE/ParE family toxin [Serpentinimonas sp.]|nr:type II toxin-antitoxin system RelE/ParE family toxin [Serpentinimonas raichei]MDO8276371.1 type II toxin-antitoxin system RelE/ParE family toxin [Serpentinimonas sp.]